MTEQERNLKVTREAIEAFQAGDAETFFALMDPEIEVSSDPELPNAGTFHGHEGYIQWATEWLEAWETFELEPLGYEAVGERHVLTNQHQFGKGKGSGIEVEMDVWYMIEYRDGLAVRMYLYPSREKALAEAEAGEAGRGKAPC